MKITHIGLIIVIFMIASLSYSQNINIDANHGVFNTDQVNKLVEVYYILYPSEWTYIQGDNNYIGTAVMSVSILSNENLLHQDLWKVEKILDNLEKKSTSGTKIDVLKYSMPAGSYSIKLSVFDANKRENSDSCTLAVHIQDNETKLLLSDIELCNKIREKKQTDNDIFIKGDLYVLPNPSSIFSKENFDLYGYLEQYSPDSDTMQSKWYITDDSGKRDISSIFSKKQMIHADNVAYYVQYDLSTLPSGIYFLNFQGSGDNPENFIKKKKFFVYNEKIKKEIKDYASTSGTTDLRPVAGITMEEELLSIEYLMKPEEKRQLKMLDSGAAKMNFLKRFWEQRDTEPETPRIEIRERYLTRVKLANRKFASEMMQKGWETDRGYVFIIYGEPDNIRNYPSSSDEKPYKIWRYDEIQGGVEFMFINISGIGSWELVHSTMRGEIKNYNWRNLLDRAHDETNIR